MRFPVLLLALLFALATAFAQRPAAAQCSMPGMSGGGHSQHESSTPPGDGKVRKSVEKLLGDERSRAVLMETLIADAGFMREFLPRVAASPEWRALVAERMGLTTVGVAPARTDSVAKAIPARPPAVAQVAYTCPMHPEVRSDRPSKCPKCGMALERVPGSGEK